MPITLTEQQLRQIDAAGPAPVVIDPRSASSYVLVPSAEYESVREAIEDERRQRAIRQAGMRNAARRLSEAP